MVSVLLLLRRLGLGSVFRVFCGLFECAFECVFGVFGVFLVLLLGGPSMEMAGLGDVPHLMPHTLYHVLRAARAMMMMCVSLFMTPRTLMMLGFGFCRLLLLLLQMPVMLLMRLRRLLHNTFPRVMMTMTMAGSPTVTTVTTVVAQRVFLPSCSAHFLFRAEDLLVGLDGNFLGLFLRFFRGFHLCFHLVAHLAPRSLRYFPRMLLCFLCCLHFFCCFLAGCTLLFRAFQHVLEMRHPPSPMSSVISMTTTLPCMAMPPCTTMMPPHRTMMMMCGTFGVFGHVLLDCALCHTFHRATGMTLCGRLLVVRLDRTLDVFLDLCLDAMHLTLNASLQSSLHPAMVVDGVLRPAQGLLGFAIDPLDCSMVAARAFRFAFPFCVVAA